MCVVATVVALILWPDAPSIEERKPDVAGSDNLLSYDQQSFEASTGGWLPHDDTTVSHSSSEAFSGSGSLVVEADPDDDDGAHAARAGTPTGTDGVPVTPGMTYRGGANVLAAGEAASVRCELRWYDSDGLMIAADTVGAMVDQKVGDWVTPTCAGPAPFGAAYASLQMALAEAAKGAVHHVDEAWLHVVRVHPRFALDILGAPITHGAQLSEDNTGLLGAGYTHDPSTDTYRHPLRGALREVDSITTSRDGQVIENVDVAGGITVAHDGVTVRNCRVRYSGTGYAIDALKHGPTGTVIEHCDITHVGDSPHEAFGIYIGEGTARWNNIWRFQVGVYVNSSNTRVEYNLVWDAQKASGTHGTGVSANSGGSNLVFYRNSIRGNSSAALALYAHSPFHGVTVRQNLFQGGNEASFCLNAGNNKNGVGVNTDIRITGNLFGRADHPDCGTYGPFFNWDGSRPGAEWCGNRWQDTGRTVGDDASCRDQR